MTGRTRTVLRLISGFLRDRPWQFALAVALCSLGLASAVGVLWLQSTLEAHARRQAAGIDIVVGAKGSALQNVLAAVYYLDVPNGNIRLSEVERLRQHPLVKRAIAVGMGDSVAGARIVGASNELLDLYGATVAEGSTPSLPMEAVIGATLARRTGLKPGDHFVGAHGMGEGASDHEGEPYRVVGVLKPTGRVIDQIVVTPLASVWQVHEGHAAPGSEHEATFALVETRGPIGVATLPRLINQTTSMQAAVPALESARLLASFDWMATVVKAFAAVLLAAALASLLGALMQSLAQREPELAVMRAMGASRATLFSMLLGEALALVSLSAVLSGGLLTAGAFALIYVTLPGLGIDATEGLQWWLCGLAAALLLAVVATIPLLRRVATMDVAALLSER